ncbi:MAG: replication initiation negative regulator SeqA [Planctomycetes bacterium]|nr:replication initiation negative regulator SeqA [Planctomycetota bacterium]
MAKELGVKKCSAIINKCQEHNFSTIKTPMSRVSPGLAGLIREWFSNPDDFQNKQPNSFTFLGANYEVHEWNEILIGVCRIMAEKEPEKFQRVLLSFRGPKRSYFSRNKKELEQHKEIPNTGIYAMTKLGANAMVRRSKDVIKRFDYNPDDLKVMAV